MLINAETKLFRLGVHGKQRARNLLRAGVSSARAQERKLRAATKRDINAVMERTPRGAIESITVGSGDGVSVLTDPVEVAVQCCEFSARRIGAMQPKCCHLWLRPRAKLGCPRVTPNVFSGTCSSAASLASAASGAGGTRRCDPR